MKKPIKELYKFGNFLLDINESTLLKDGKAIILSPKLLDLLLLLVENNGHLVTKDEILNNLWPDSFVEENNLTVNISALRKILGDGEDGNKYIETIPKRGYRFLAKVEKVEDKGYELDKEPLKDRESSFSINLDRLEPAGGAVALNSEFYIVRAIDSEFHKAISRRDSIVLVKGAAQMGKTSLLARGLEKIRESGGKIVLTDFRALDASELESADKLFLTLAEIIVDQLELDLLPKQDWSSERGPSVNFGRFIRRAVLSKISESLVWGMDEVDRLFGCAFSDDVFSLFRSWHNARSLDPMGPWKKLTMVISYSTEPHLFIRDANKSPFNVGTRLTMEDFSFDQVRELNLKYGSPLQNKLEVERYFQLVGGHPYLVCRGLYELALRSYGIEVFEKQADKDEGPLGDHLRKMLRLLFQDTILCEIVKGMLKNQPCSTEESFYRLRSTGLISGESAKDAKIRCQIYTNYLKRHML